MLKEWKKQEKHQEQYSEIKGELNIVKMNGLIEALILNDYHNGLQLLAEIALMDYNINFSLYDKGNRSSKLVFDFYESKDKERILSFLLNN